MDVAAPPVRLAVVDDFEVIVRGVASMFDEYGARVVVVELAADEPVDVDVDVALFDTFAQHEADGPDLDVLIANPHARRVAVYTWAFDQRLIDLALAKGASGYLSKRLPAEELVDALERIHAGHTVVSAAPRRPHRPDYPWPGRSEGLSDRESEVLALVARGLSNREIAEIMYLSVNTVKTHIRTAYRKIGVATRTQAAIWAVGHGVHAHARSVDRWRTETPASRIARSGNAGW